MVADTESKKVMDKQSHNIWANRVSQAIVFAALILGSTYLYSTGHWMSGSLFLLVFLGVTANR